MDIYAKRLCGMENKFVSGLKLVANTVRHGVWKFLYYMETSILKSESSGFWCS